MPNPLDRNALPNHDRMRSTTAWILQREPVLVRIAPLVVLFVVIAMGVWIATAKVTVYDSVPARVSEVNVGTHSDTLRVQLEPGQTAALAANSPVVVVPDAGGKHLDATVLTLDQDTGFSTMAVPSSSQIATGPVALRVGAGRRTLLSELVGTARAGSRKP